MSALTVTKTSALQSTAVTRAGGIFAQAPDARIITGIITYKGSVDFEATHDDTGDQNIGSQVAPIAMRDACDCVEETESGDSYGADEANGAQCAAMANALRAIQTERQTLVRA